MWSTGFSACCGSSLLTVLLSIVFFALASFILTPGRSVFGWHPVYLKKSAVWKQPYWCDRNQPRPDENPIPYINADKAEIKTIIFRDENCVSGLKLCIRVIHNLKKKTYSAASNVQYLQSVAIITESFRTSNHLPFERCHIHEDTRRRLEWAAWLGKDFSVTERER